MIEYCVDVELVGASGRHDERRDALAPHLVFDPDDRRVVDARVGSKRVDHFAGIDVLAARNDPIAPTVENPQPAAVVPVADVAGVKALSENAPSVWADSRYPGVTVGPETTSSPASPR